MNSYPDVCSVVINFTPPQGSSSAYGSLPSAHVLLAESLAISSELGMRPLMERGAVPAGDIENITSCC